ncbi:hypothetical protein N566_14785 [Streptomycetaceae bacterium MP113-05]|nr:hypothetical protein N566_14785 [Streptomycetaceae bacterium MP113-05]
MTSPRSTYGGGYYAAPAFPDTPIYDMLVAERGTPQIAPIRVPAAYDTGSHLPALQSALPALPSGQGSQPQYGYPGQQPSPLQQAPSPYVPQRQGMPRGYGYPGPQGGYQGQQGHPGGAPQQPQHQMRPVAPRPAAPRQVPGGYDDPYGRPYQGRGY